MSVTVIDVWVSDSRINSIGKSSYGNKDVMVGAEAWISWQ